ncbi:MAG: hypothetical protein HY741_07180 [Chloroflexi bacterium]|nr:hypothetical protein [Chloroflexota bacterium]
MSTVTLAPEMYARVEQLAQARHTTIDSVLTEAVKRYLWEIQREIIANETRMYRQRHTELKQKFLGQFIAMHNGEVVDTDADINVLRMRVRSRFGLEPVLMTQVEEEV